MDIDETLSFLEGTLNALEGRSTNEPEFFEVDEDEGIGGRDESPEDEEARQLALLEELEGRVKKQKEKDRRKKEIEMAKKKAQLEVKKNKGLEKEELAKEKVIKAGGAVEVWMALLQRYGWYRDGTIEVRNVKFPLRQLKKMQFDRRRLTMLGFDENEIKKARVTGSHLGAGGGVGAKLSASIDAAKSAGTPVGGYFTGKELAAEGVTAAELKNVKPNGFTVMELCKLYSISDLFKQQNILKFSFRELVTIIQNFRNTVSLPNKVTDLPHEVTKDWGAIVPLNSNDEPPPLLLALKLAGYTAAELRDSDLYSMEQMREEAGMTVSELIKAYTPAELVQSKSFTANELSSAGISADELKLSGMSKKQLRGLSDTTRQTMALKNIGMTVPELQKLKFSAEAAADLREKGVSVKQLLDIGFGTKELKEAGCTARELKSAGCSDQEINALGFENIKKIEYKNYLPKQNKI